MAEDRIDRRCFVTAAGVAGLAAAGARAGTHQDAAQGDASSQDSPPREPAPEPTGPLGVSDIIGAERVAGVAFTPEEREQMLPALRAALPGYDRRRAMDIPNETGPACVFAPLDPGRSAVPDGGFAAPGEARPLPEAGADIAFAPAWEQAVWVRRREITSERLTRIYLDRLQRHAPALQCVVTMTPELALRQARAFDAESQGNSRPRSALHGVPCGVKDLFDTAGIRTTYGAAPFKDRVAERDAWIVDRLESAGCPLLCKLTLGALAYGDIWFGGRTNNPFNTQQGSSGSSAGSAAAAVAGLVGFAIGTETLGSIMSPSVRCGAAGLRPTFGRVPRDGAMALCWSLDKIGPICRTMADCAAVLDVLAPRTTQGIDDASCRPGPFAFDTSASLDGVRVGYAPAWFERGALDFDRAAIDALRDAGAALVEIEWPDLPLEPLLTILYAEAASAFERLTLDDKDDEMVWQAPQAWPNTFRRMRLTSAVELMQAERVRRMVCERVRGAMAGVDALIAPVFAGGLLTATNFTGHPQACVRTGMRSNQRPHATSVWGHPGEEGLVARLAHEIEQRAGAWVERPVSFAG